MTTTPKTSRARRRVGVLAAAALAVGAFAAPGAAHAASCPGADVPLNGPNVTLGQQRQASDALICVANEARAIRGLSQLTVDQSLSDFARNKSDTITRGSNNVACGGVAENVLPFSACVESVEVLVPAPTPRQLIDGILTGNGNAIENPDVTTIGAGVSNGNPKDGPTGAGVTADVLTITPTNAGTTGGGASSGNQNPPVGPVGDGDCADYALDRRPDLAGVVNGNAGLWADQARAAGRPVDKTPHVGDVMVFQPGVQGADATTGHVAVESVNGNTVHISEQNFQWNGVGGLGQVTQRDVDISDTSRIDFIS